MALPGARAENQGRPERQQGVVKWFDAKKGIGFIQRPGLPDVFVHFAQIISVVRSLEKGEAVEFTVKLGSKGPTARDVVRL
jgi:CspA family cold shock protein